MLVVTLLLIFAFIGIRCFVSPAWGLQHFRGGFRRGGELLTAWNELGMTFLGLVFGGFALYVLYSVLRDCF